MRRRASGRLARRHQPALDLLFARSPDVFVARPGHLPLLALLLGLRHSSPGQGRGLRDQPHRPGLSHPLALMMLTALASGRLIGLDACFGSWNDGWRPPRRGRLRRLRGSSIMRSSPELLSGRLPLRFLVGLPIGSSGGNSWSCWPGRIDRKWGVAHTGPGTMLMGDGAASLCGGESGSTRGCLRTLGQVAAWLVQQPPGPPLPRGGKKKAGLFPPLVRGS